MLEEEQELDLDEDLYAVVDEPVSPKISPPPKRLTIPPKPKKASAPKPKAPVLPVSPPKPSSAPPADPVAVKPPVVSDVAQTELPDISEELDEIEFFSSQGLEEEAQGIIEGLLLQFPDDPRVLEVARANGIGGEEPEAAQEARFDLDALAEDLGLDDVTHDEVVNEIDAVFSQFKAGVDEQVSQTDYTTHYDLGQAYKEMGLFDDAIREFEIASGDAKRAGTSQMMIGVCQAGMGKFEEAQETFQKGLELPGIAEDQKLALLYELAKSYEVQGRADDAIKIYNDVLNQDPGFADVVDRIEALEEGDNSRGPSVFS